MKPIVPFVHGLSKDNEFDWIQALRNAAPELDIRLAADIPEDERCKIEVAIVANPDPTNLAYFPNLKWVQSLWAGVERLLSEMPGSDVQIVRMIDPQLANTMAEAVLAWTFYLHRSMPKYAAQQDQRIWMQHELPTASERSVGILGLGHLGLKSAERLKSNGFNVLGWSRTARNIRGVTTFSGADGLTEIAAQAEIVVVLLPSTPETRNLIGDRFIDNMKPGGSLINFARGDIILQESLLKALDTRRVEHAVLDVFAVEPLPEKDLLWSNPNITILPHISAPTNKHTASEVVARNIVNYYANHQIPKSVSRKHGY